MNIALTEIIKMVKEIPEKYLEETYKEVEKIKDKAQQEQSTKTEQCPHCSSMHIVRNGHKHHKQAFLCRTCKKSFVETTNTAIEHSHSSETVWKSVIRDTVKGVALTTTARNLAISPVTAFNMRHKILFTLEQETLRHPVELSGICETDETYVLESVKGRKIRDDYHRKARKHGAVAEKRGISNEYICVCTSVTENNKSMSVSVNRATPSKQEILEVFGNRVDENTLILCDGAKSYDVLEQKCTVANTRNINKVNGLHSLIKHKIRNARGFATIYLNRYNALFSKIYANVDKAVDEIFFLMTESNKFYSIEHTKFNNLLKI